MLWAVLLCALFTIPVAWNARQGISSDGLAYLEVAENAIHLGPQYLLSNAYWSPAYPALLAVALKVTHPSPAFELGVVHGLDWILCTANYLSFTCFLYYLLRWIQATHGDEVLGGGAGFRAILALAYTLVFVANIDSSLWYVGPNILMEGAVYLIAGLCIRLSLPDSRLIHHAAFGIAMALGYAAKAVLFPLSLILLGILFIWPAARNSGRKGVLVAAAFLLLAMSPFVAFLSYSKGRLTFSDSGRLNYAWYVNNVPRSILWKDPLASGVVFRHSPYRISSEPAIAKFEGPGPVKSSYPYWYDPSWWYDGLTSRFDLRQQMQQFRRSAGFAPKVMLSGSNVFQLAERWIPLFAGLMALAVLGFRIRSAYEALRPHRWLLLWPAAALLTFAAVLIEYRYVVPFVVIAWVAVFAVAWMVVKPERWIGVNVTVAAGLLLAYGPNFARDAMHNQKRPAAWANMAVAKKLSAMGVQPGDELASVNFAEGAYFARLAGARFTQEIWTDDATALSSLPEAEVQQMLTTLRANGAKALFSSWRPAFQNDSGWVLVTEHTYVRMLR